MKIKILTTPMICFICLLSASSNIHAQEALNELNTQDQSAQAYPTSNTTIVSDDAKAKAMVPVATQQFRTTKLLAGAQNSKYTLGPADVVTITVLRHPEVSGIYVLNNEGNIQFEFVGDIQLSNLSKEEAGAEIAKKLSTYIVNPDVTVKITEYNSKVVYVVGEVGIPGKIFMRGDTITVRDALLAARLPQLTAATDNAKMFTPSPKGKAEQKKVNVYALLYQGDLRENYTMKPGDTIYLPATLWAKVARFINPITQPVSETAGTAAAVGL